MNKIILMFAVVALTHGLYAQTSVQSALVNAPPPPAREAPARAYNALTKDGNDYFSEQGAMKCIWSLRDRNWVEIQKPLFGVTSGLIKGPRELKPGSIQEYQLACVSLFQGTAKSLWVSDSKQAQPIKVGTVHSNDDVEIEWEMRVSPGIRVVNRPILPATVRYLEPIVSTFQVELNSQDVQRIEIYVNAYQNGKLVRFAWITATINKDGYSESRIEEEKNTNISSEGYFQKWNQNIILEKQRISKELHRPNGLHPGEFVTDADDPNNH